MPEKEHHMAARRPTDIYTTADIAAILANPHCPPVLRSAWQRLMVTAESRATAIRRNADTSHRQEVDADDIAYWGSANGRALIDLDKTLKRLSGIIPALVAGADPYAFTKAAA
jgi:hypothetical protein